MRSGVHDDERRRHRIHPRTGGHVELHDDWGKSYYYLTDATGNVLGLVDDAGKRTHTYAYGPTGLPRGTTTEAVPQPDPSGQETNPYLYAAGDPISNSDPTGLFSLSDALDAGESIFSTATGCLAGSAPRVKPASSPLPASWPTRGARRLTRDGRAR
jgi:hypothetical protein